MRTPSCHAIFNSISIIIAYRSSSGFSDIAEPLMRQLAPAYVLAGPKSRLRCLTNVLLINWKITLYFSAAKQSSAESNRRESRLSEKRQLCMD